MVKRLEEHLHRENFLCLLVAVLDELGQVKENREPQALEHAEPYLSCVWLSRCLLSFLLQLSSETILGRLVGHLLKVSLMEECSLFAHEVIQKRGLLLEAFGAQLQELLRLLTLLEELLVRRILVQAVD